MEVRVLTYLGAHNYTNYTGNHTGNYTSYYVNTTNSTAWGDTNTTAYSDADWAAYDSTYDSTYAAIAGVRLAAVIIGLTMMVYYKAQQGIVLWSEQAKGGLPVGSGVRTLWHIAKLAYVTPSRGLWVIGHAICMCSSFAGAIYLLYLIVDSGELTGPEYVTSEWNRAIYTFRTAATLFIVPTGLLQVSLIAYGQYGYHRWLGRLLVRLTTSTTIFTLVLQQSLGLFIVTAVLLTLEIVAFFAYKWATEVWGWEAACCGCCSARARSKSGAGAPSKSCCRWCGESAARIAPGLPLPKKFSYRDLGSANNECASGGDATPGAGSRNGGSSASVCASSCDDECDGGGRGGSGRDRLGSAYEGPYSVSVHNCDAAAGASLSCSCNSGTCRDREDRTSILADGARIYAAESNDSGSKDGEGPIVAMTMQGGAGAHSAAGEGSSVSGSRVVVTSTTRHATR